MFRVSLHRFQLVEGDAMALQRISLRWRVFLHLKLLFRKRFIIMCLEQIEYSFNSFQLVYSVTGVFLFTVHFLVQGKFR